MACGVTSMSRIKARRHLIEITAALKVPCWVRSISVIKVVVAIPNKSHSLKSGLS